MFCHRWIFALALAFALTDPGRAHTEPTSAQPTLPTAGLTIGEKKLIAEVADDDAERQAGMMFRSEMKDGTAMVFVFEGPQRAGFWMRNTVIPLSVAYLSASGMILEIYDLQPKDERPVESKFETIAYAIEVPQGWFGRNGIFPGSLVKGLPPPARRP